MGRWPLALVGSKYVACAERDGKDVIVIENNEKTNFKQFTKIEVSMDVYRYNGKIEIKYLLQVKYRQINIPKISLLVTNNNSIL